jgi:hypothetical protein
VKTLTEKDRKELFPGGFKPLHWALVVYAALVPVAYFVALRAPGRKDWPLWAFIVVLHGLFCALVAAVCKLVVSALEFLPPPSRFRTYTGHMENFIAVLAIWPFCIAIIMLVWKLTHG